METFVPGDTGEKMSPWRMYGEEAGGEGGPLPNSVCLPTVQQCIDPNYRQAGVTNESHPCAIFVTRSESGMSTLPCCVTSGNEGVPATPGPTNPVASLIHYIKCPVTRRQASQPLEGFPRKSGTGRLLLLEFPALFSSSRLLSLSV